MSEQKWNLIGSCPVNEYVLFRFDGPFHDSECPGVAVGKLYGDCNIWLTAIWAASSADRDPVAWCPLPSLPEPVHLQGEGEHRG